jgi:hypothetical protein
VNPEQAAPGTEFGGREVHADFGCSHYRGQV